MGVLVRLFCYSFIMLLGTCWSSELRADINSHLAEKMPKCKYEGVIDEATKELINPLSQAIDKNDLATLKCLVDKGYDLNVKWYYEKDSYLSPLTMASHPLPFNIETLSFLLKHGAKPFLSAEPITTILSMHLHDLMNYHEMAVTGGDERPLSQAERQDLINRLRRDIDKFPQIMKLLLMHGYVIKPEKNGITGASGSLAKLLLDSICRGYRDYEYDKTGLVELLVNTNKGKAIFTDEDMKIFKEKDYLETTTNPYWKCENMMYMAFGKK